MKKMKKIVNTIDIILMIIKVLMPSKIVKKYEKNKSEFIHG